MNATNDFKITYLDQNTTFKDDPTIQYLNCFTLCDDIYAATKLERWILVSMFVLSILITIVVNSLAIYANIKTGDWNNQSMRLVLYMSITDLMNAAFGFTAHIAHIVFLEILDCQQRRSLLFVSHLFFYFSLYTVLFIALDRFLHVYLTMRYKTVITLRKFNILLSIYIILAVFQAIITTFGPGWFGKAGGARFSAPINTLFMSVSVCLYVTSIVKLRRHNKQSRQVSQGTRNLARLATIFLCILATTYSPLIVFTVMSGALFKWLGARMTVIALYSCFLISNCNGFLNALAYLIVNNGASRLIKDLIRSNSLVRMMRNKNNETEETKETAL